MIGTIAVHGTNGGVMVPFGLEGMFIQGKRVKVKVCRVSADVDVPLVVREALVGMELYPVLTKQEILEQCGKSFNALLPDSARVTYTRDVIEMLENAGKKEAAKALRSINQNRLDMYVLEPEIYSMVEIQKERCTL